MGSRKQKFKTNPKFWWDFHTEKNKMSIIVQTDNDNLDVENGMIAVFRQEDMATNIDNAEKLISSLQAGRISIKECIREYS